MKLNNNDERIEKLIDQVNKQREKIKNMKKNQELMTNLTLTYEGKIYNLNVLTKDELVLLAAKLGSLKVGIEHLNDNNFGYNELCLCTYSIDDWINDILVKIKEKNIKEEKKKLNSLESKLKDMFSEDKKKEKELDEIEAMLKNS